MNMNYFKNYHKRTIIEDIHMELFEESISNKYYMLGATQAFSQMYLYFKEYEDTNIKFTCGEFKNLIEKTILNNDNKLVRDYFTRLIKQED